MQNAVTAEVKAVTEASVTLTMPLEIARTLLALTYVTGGHPETTYRGHVDKISEALGEAGVRINLGRDRFHGNITAKDLR